VEATVGGGRRLRPGLVPGRVQEASKGDIANQVLVAQMFFSGYGTPQERVQGIATHLVQN
jgi:hypothetical protein